MFRRNLVRRGHQLIKEPLPNQEHNTFARGRMTFGNMSSELYVHMGSAVLGLNLAVYSMWSARSTEVPTIDSKGAMSNQ